MCRIVQITLGINLRPSPIKASTQLNFLGSLNEKWKQFFSPNLSKNRYFYRFFSYNSECYSRITDSLLSNKTTPLYLCLLSILTRKEVFKTFVGFLVVSDHSAERIGDNGDGDDDDEYMDDDI